MRAYLLVELTSWEIVSLADLNEIREPYPETGSTFLDNARGKSLFYGRGFGGYTLGEDSGLEIDALEGAPGVYSARFAGPQATDETNIAKVLRLMQGIPREKRSARFVSSLVLSRGGRVIREFQDRVEGEILEACRGSGGFGYDPLFHHPPSGRTFAELAPEEKNRVSHRGRVLRRLRRFLKECETG
jgi:XTP/dITP diphosphohydrolase